MPFKDYLLAPYKLLVFLVSGVGPDDVAIPGPRSGPSFPAPGRRISARPRTPHTPVGTRSWLQLLILGLSPMGSGSWRRQCNVQ